MASRRLFKNRELRLTDYKHLCGNKRERNLLGAAKPAVDRFVEIRSPKGKRDFDPADWRALYCRCFPNPDEQSPWSEMLKTIRDNTHMESSPELQKLYGDLRYHDVVALRGRQVVGFTSFVTMPLDGESTLVYNLYSGKADPRFMRERYGSQGGHAISGLTAAFGLIGHGVAQEDAMRLGYGPAVAGTIMDGEFIGQAGDVSGIVETKRRLGMLGHLGALALMLDTGSGGWITPCVQPALSGTTEQLLMHLLFRGLGIDSGRAIDVSGISMELARKLVVAYYHSYEWQSSKEEVGMYHRDLEARLGAAKRAILVPPEHLPDITELARSDPLLKAQVERDYGSVESHSRKIREALSRRG